jgi:predicted ATPase/DNA-binding SARP family transcriptional activator
MMAQLTISLLGSIQITLDGEPVTDFATDKVRALLAYLVVEANRPHRRDALAGLLWPDQPQARARQSLRQTISYLRRTLGDQDNGSDDKPFLLVTRRTVQFNAESDHWLDVAAFKALARDCRAHRHSRLRTCLPCTRRLEQMAELHQGSFMEQFFLIDSNPFEEWASLEREWLHQWAIEALSHLAHYYGRRGDYAQARQYAWRQVALEPWREEAHRHLMHLLALDGQRSAALTQYEKCRRVLDEELGVEPTAETTALYEQIRLGELRPPARLHNLPPPPTPFVGREEELAELADLLANPGCRLVTLIGPGGIGKTRLALQAAAEHIGAFEHGIFFVSLASVGATELVVPTLAGALEFSFYGPEDTTEQLLNYLRGKQMLLVLDNLEHILEGSGLLADILKCAPGVALLVTSRERLNLREEWVYEVKGLTYPITGEATEKSESYSAVRLFLQTARQARRRFELSETRTPHVVRICQIVAGMPLGVELAAAWVQVRSCEEIAQEIEQNLDVLTTRLRNVPERHRSLRAAFEHSWNLLSEQEKTVFHRLSVFRGGFQAAAAAEVAAASPSILLALVDKSLLYRDASDRYQVHELLRQYTAEKLEEVAHERERTEALHSGYYAAFLQQWEEALRGERQGEALEAIGAEIDNVRRAWRWALTQIESGQDAELALDVVRRSTTSLYLFYATRDWYQEGEEAFGQAAAALESLDRLSGVPAGEKERLLGRLLAHQGKCCEFTAHSDKARELFETSLAIFHRLGLDGQRETALPLHGLGYMAHIRGEYEQAEQYLQDSMAVYRKAEDGWGIATALANLSLVARRQGTFEEAKRRAQASLALRREIGDRRGIASSLSNLGLVYCDLGEYAEAKKALEEALQICRQLDYKVGIGNVTTGLCQASFRLGDVDAAEQYGRESLTVYQDIGDYWGVAIAFNNLGCMAAELGDYAKAKRLYQESIAVYRQVGIKSGLAKTLANLGEACCQSALSPLL